jgi:hypothetical protein
MHFKLLAPRSGLGYRFYVTLVYVTLVRAGAGRSHHGETLAPRSGTLARSLTRGDPSRIRELDLFYAGGRIANRKTVSRSAPFSTGGFARAKRSRQPDFARVQSSAGRQRVDWTMRTASLIVAGIGEFWANGRRERSPSCSSTLKKIALPGLLLSGCSAKETSGPPLT